MNKQLLTLVSIMILSTSAFAGSNEENALVCSSKMPAAAISKFLSGLGESHATTDAVIDSGGEKLALKLTPLVGFDIPQKVKMKESEVKELVILAHCFQALLEDGDLKFKNQFAKKMKIITDNNENLNFEYPLSEDAVTAEDKHHAKIRQIVIANADAIAFVQAFFDGSKYLTNQDQK